MIAKVSKYISRFLNWKTMRMVGMKPGLFTKGIRAAIMLTTRCNLHCDYCPMFIYGEPVRYKDATVAEWKTFIERFPHWITMFYVTGGETTLYKELPELINWLIERKHRVLLFTNLWKPEVILNINPSWRFTVIATYHKDDKMNRFKDALQLVRTKHHVRFQEIDDNEIEGSKRKPNWSADYFKYEDATIHFAPDAPTSLTMKIGCVNLYKEKS